MSTTSLLHELISASAERAPTSPAVTWGHGTLSYRELDDQVGGLAGGLMALEELKGDK